MTHEEQKKLRRRYHSLRGLHQVVNQDLKAYVLRGSTVDLVRQAVARLKSDFPDLVPPFDFRSAQSGRE